MKYRLHLITFWILLSFTGCGNSQHTSLKDFTAVLYSPEYATGFSVTGTPHGASTLLTIRNPWQSAEQIQQQVFLHREGESVPDGFTGQVVHTPVRRVVCMSSGHVAMLDAIGETRRICGVSGIDYISNPYIDEHKLCGEVRDVGYDTNLNFELLVALEPDVVLLFGITGENTTVTGKLAELGIPYLYIGEYVEESPLGKAEWLVALAELCDQSEYGAEVFSGICERYNALKAQVASQPENGTPKVMLNTPYRDSWFMPSTRSYMVQLIRDAGGDYLYTKNDSNASTPIDLEEAYAMALKADFWLNTGQAKRLSELKSQNPKFATLPVVHAGKIYNNNRRCTPAGGSDFWESGTVCPDKVLADLIGIFHGDDSNLYFYQRLE